jgi:hypothetical protein
MLCIILLHQACATALLVPGTIVVNHETGDSSRPTHLQVLLVPCACWQGDVPVRLLHHCREGLGPAVHAEGESRRVTCTSRHQRHQQMPRLSAAYH